MEAPDGVEQVAADVGTTEGARRACEDAAVVYHCVQPNYTKWPELFPPITVDCSPVAVTPRHCPAVPEGDMVPAFKDDDRCRGGCSRPDAVAIAASARRLRLRWATRYRDTADESAHRATSHAGSSGDGPTAGMTPARRRRRIQNQFSSSFRLEGA